MLIDFENSIFFSFVLCPEKSDYLIMFMMPADLERRDATGLFRQGSHP